MAIFLSSVLLITYGVMINAGDSSITNNSNGYIPDIVPTGNTNQLKYDVQRPPIFSSHVYVPDIPYHNSKIPDWLKKELTSSDSHITSGTCLPTFCENNIDKANPKYPLKCTPFILVPDYTKQYVSIVEIETILRNMNVGELQFTTFCNSPQLRKIPQLTTKEKAREYTNNSIVISLAKKIHKYYMNDVKKIESIYRWLQNDSYCSHALVSKNEMFLYIAYNIVMNEVDIPFIPEDRIQDTDSSNVATGHSADICYKFDDFLDVTTQKIVDSLEFIIFLKQGNRNIFEDSPDDSCPFGS